MNEPDQPLSIELLHGAVAHAVQTGPSDVPFSHLLLNQEGWRCVVEQHLLSHVYGFPIKLITQKDLKLILDKFRGSFSYSDDSAYLVPEPQYDQKKLLELDLGFEKTLKIEQVLRSGKIKVRPSRGDFQYWSDAVVTEDKGHALLSKVASEYYWQLGGGLSIQNHDGKLTFMDRSGSADSRLGHEVTDVLIARYGVGVDTSGLKKEAESLREKLATLERRAAHYDKLTTKA